MAERWDLSRWEILLAWRRTFPTIAAASVQRVGLFQLLKMPAEQARDENVVVEDRLDEIGVRPDIRVPPLGQKERVPRGVLMIEVPPDPNPVVQWLECVRPGESARFTPALGLMFR